MLTKTEVEKLVRNKQALIDFARSRGYNPTKQALKYWKNALEAVLNA